MRTKLDGIVRFLQRDANNVIRTFLQYYVKNIVLVGTSIITTFLQIKYIYIFLLCKHSVFHTVNKGRKKSNKLS